MDIKTKYNFGELVYPISYKTEEIKVFHNCPLCKDKGLVMLNNQEYTCPECRGYTYHIEDGDIEWYVTKDQGKIGRIGVEFYASKYEGKYGNESTIKYMLDSTGIGSGTLWKEEDLFLSLEEAQAECEKRNIEIKNNNMKS